jgi:pimeloyl-ACP methyl ester carboxylesterase
MPDSHAAAHTLDVPGAQLYYERRGTGPLLMLIGSPMDSTGFAALADALVGRYTVVTYDPRGIGGSSRQDTTGDVTPSSRPTTCTACCQRSAACPRRSSAAAVAPS